jgi:hypothetical protein
MLPFPISLTLSSLHIIVVWLHKILYEQNLEMMPNNAIALMSRGNSYGQLQPPNWEKALVDHKRVS